MIKAINAQSADSRNSVGTVVIEELQVFDPDVVISDLKVMGGGLAGRKSLGRLAVMSESEIRSLAVQRCDRASNCRDCVALQDPYCAWDVRASRCSSGDWTSNMANSFLQSVVTGKHPQCPEDAASSSPPSKPASDLSSNGAFLYSYGNYLDHQAPLGQVVNIVDNQDNIDSKSGGRNSEATGSQGNAAGSDDGGVQVLIDMSTLVNALHCFPILRLSRHRKYYSPWKR